MPHLPITVVTGLSGAGKSTALRVFEDLGHVCVDGLPVNMVAKVASLLRGQGQTEKGLVFGLDLRQHDFVDNWNRARVELESIGVHPRILFLESRLDTLVRRYATTRRPHPLESQSLGLEQALEEETSLLEPIRTQADLVVDTSEYSVHDLRRMIQEKWGSLNEKGGNFKVHLISFGFKHAVPTETDMIFDLRFLVNPYFDLELRPLTGTDRRIADYVYENELGRAFKNRFLDFLDFMLPLYAREGRYRLTIGLGCTGGRHRSVATAEMVYRHLKHTGYSVTLEHRHMELE